MKNIRLSNSIALLAALLASAVIIIIGGTSYFVMRMQIARNIETTLKHEAAQVAEYIGGRLSAVVTTLSSLTENSLIINSLMDSYPRNNYLGPFLRDFRQINDVPIAVTLTDFTGDPISGAGDIPTREDWAKHVIDQGHDWAEIAQDRFGEVLLVAEPIRYSGTLSPEGALVYRLALANVLPDEDQLHSIITHLHIVHRYSADAGEVHRSHFSQVKDNPIRNDRIVQQAPIRVPSVLAPLNLAIEVAAPSNLLKQPLWNLFQAYALIGTLSIIIVITLSIAAGRYLTHSLQDLEAVATTVVVSGSFDHRFNAEGPEDIVRLGQAFNHMLDRLAQTYQELEASQELFELAVKASHDGVWDWDLQTGNMWFSPRWKEMLGYQDGELANELATWRTRVENWQGNWQMLRAYAAGNIPEFRLIQRFRHKNGSLRYVLVRAIRKQDAHGETYRVVGANTDITRVKEQELMLRETARRLNRYVQELEVSRQQLLQRAGELIRSNAELEQFAYIASHDLQEPLRKVNTFADRLKSKYGEVLGEQGRDYLERMQSASQRMRLLINDLLAFSRVSTKGLSLQRVDLSELVQGVLSDLEISIEQSGGRVEADDLPVIEADPMQMRQLFQNLIGNSLKYCRSDVPPRVRIKRGMLTEESGCLCSDGSNNPLCEIIFEDNGIGFEQQYAERIFGIFQRLHGRQAYAGTGIGLAICHKIVERHRGQIFAVGKPGEGAVFTVRLPLAQASGITT